MVFLHALLITFHNVCIPILYRDEHSGQILHSLHESLENNKMSLPTSFAKKINYLLSGLGAASRSNQSKVGEDLQRQASERGH